MPLALRQFRPLAATLQSYVAGRCADRIGLSRTWNADYSIVSGREGVRNLMRHSGYSASYFCNVLT